MTAISRRWRGGRIYNNTRTRERQRRKCVKPTALTTHSPPKAFARPRTTTRPSPALLPHPRSPDAHPQAARCIPRRPHDPFPTEDLRPPPHGDTPFPNTSARPRSPDAHPQAAPCIPRRPHNSFPAEGLLPPPHNDAPFPSTSAPPRSADARPQAARCIPRRPHNPFPAAPRCLPFHSASGTKKRHRTVHVRCRMFRSTVVAVGHLGW